MDALSTTSVRSDFNAKDYWTQSTRPLVSLVFIVPMLLLYEVGVIALGHNAVRNGADAWMREWLDLLGFGQYFLLPVLTCGILLGWHHITHQRWHVPAHVLALMWLESVVLALILLIIAHGQSEWFSEIRNFITCDTRRTSAAELSAGVIAYMGAGIYEELLFRLMLLPAVIALFRYMQFQMRTSVIAAIVLSSVLFSLAHYQLDFRFLVWHIRTTHGYSFEWFSFIFRFSAGVFFSLLFLRRGFGIAVGSHALYDILAVLL